MNSQSPIGGSITQQDTPEGGVPTAIFMDDYYGTYSDSKYRFMIKTLLEARGADNFSLAEMFRWATITWGGLSWDYMISQDEAMQKIQDCHDLFIEEYDKNPDAYDFHIPTPNRLPAERRFRQG